MNRVARTPAGGYTGDFKSICYHASMAMFVAVGESGCIQTSYDGKTWTARTAAGGYTGIFEGVAYAGGLLVAVGTGGAIQTSTNGSAWTSRTAAGGFGDAFFSVAYGGGLWVAVGEGRTIQTSTNGTTWIARTAASSPSTDFYDVAYGGGTFVVMAGSPAGYCQSSANGATWVARTIPTTRAMYGVAYGAGRFVASGYYTALAASVDGITWTATEDAVELAQGARMAYGAGCFAVASRAGKCWVTDTRGISRKYATRYDLAADMAAVCFGNNSFVFVGENGAIEQAFI
jgi:hypothetical protein